MVFGAERRRHHPARGVLPVLVVILTLIKCQMLDQRLAKNAHPLLPGPPDRLMRLLAGHMDDVDRCTGRIGDHDGAVGGFAFDLGRDANRHGPRDP